MMSSGNRFFINFAGFPPYIAYGGTSDVTTDSAATTAPSPIWTPGMITALRHNQTSFSMTVSPFDIAPSRSFFNFSDQQPPNIGKGYVVKVSIRWLPPFMINFTSFAMAQNFPIFNLSPIKSNKYRTFFSKFSEPSGSS